MYNVHIIDTIFLLSNMTICIYNRLPEIDEYVNRKQDRWNSYEKKITIIITI